MAAKLLWRRPLSLRKNSPPPVSIHFLSMSRYVRRKISQPRTNSLRVPCRIFLHFLYMKIFICLDQEQTTKRNRDFLYVFDC